jgi:tRNA(Ile)-lysidine synthase
MVDVRNKYIVAVSGGVDSVVLLDMLVNDRLPNVYRPMSTVQLIIAHFDHGIRPGSADDATFVRQLVGDYEVPFETKREVLGANASEELARGRRYAFLREVAKKHDAKIMTAHHADDLVETIAINLTRGTGWRGLAVLDSPDIERPLLGMTKAELITYAKEHKLDWHEDSTNQDTKYLRNDLRQKLTKFDDGSRELLRLYRQRQVSLRKIVDNESDRLVGASPYSRHLLISVPDETSVELLRGVFLKEGMVVPTRPQLARALHAIKVLQPGKRYEVADGISLRFTKTNFVVERVPKVIAK